MHLVQTALSVLVVGFFTLLGIPLAAIGFYIFFQRIYLTLFGERTTGRILGLVDNRSDEPSQRSTRESSAFLCIVFTDSYAREHRVTTDTSVSPEKYHRGEVVPLLYQSNRPQTFVVDQFWLKWTIPLAFGGIGLLLLIPLIMAIAQAWPKPAAG